MGHAAETIGRGVSLVPYEEQLAMTGAVLSIGGITLNVMTVALIGVGMFVTGILLTRLAR